VGEEESMSDAWWVRTFRAMAGGAGLSLALSATSFGQPPPPAVAGSAPATPVAWLISKGPHEIQVLIRDQSTNENVFRIERRPAGPGAWTLVTDIRLAQLTRQTGHELPFTDQHLTENAEYHYRIRAGRTVDPALPTVWSNAVVLSGRTRLDPGPPASEFCTSAGAQDCDATFNLSNGQALKYYRSYPLDQLRLTITRVVLAVHGLGRNAQGTYNNLVGAVTAADVRSETLVVAPLFGEEDWGEAWKAGAQSHDGVSSFAAGDQLIMAMTDPNIFPNVREVVVAGHSAGGQFTQRYAATSSIESQRPGLKFRYVVANPSSYVYLNDQRPVASNGDQSSVRFGTPRRCSSYNEYKYGLQDRNRYASRLTADQIRDQYKRRYVVYLLGGDDNDIGSDDLDHSCEADVQGAQRLARGRFYYRHMMQFFPENRQRKVIVGGVAHNGGAMFRSGNGQEALFF
jgi:hypothetical protein